MANIVTSKNGFVPRVQRAIKTWRKMNEPILKHRQTMLYHYASGYFERGKTKRHVMNLIDRGVGIVVPYLSMSNPHALVSTRIPQLTPWAYSPRKV